MSFKDLLKQYSSVESLEEKNGIFHANLSRDNFASVVTDLVLTHKVLLSLLYGTDNRKENKTYGVHVVLSLPHHHERCIVSCVVPEQDAWYPSITATVMAAHWYERYLHDMFGVVPKGHPDLRRLVHHENIPEGTHPLRKDFGWNTKLDHANIPYPMHHVDGEGIYEIPVGPIHAGIIEPGHFRFNVAGERIITLEGKLFFTHKGVEKLLESKTVQEGLPFIERVSGDMAASHALAYVQAVESLAGITVPERALYIRTLLCELERLTMHIHDLANIAGMGTGYTFVAAQGFRIKERLVRLSEKVLGNRFWRGAIVPGGVAKDFDETTLDEIQSIAQKVYEEMKDILSIALGSDGLRERLETTGVLPKEAAEALGAVGLPARASGLTTDIRYDYPYAMYTKYHAPRVMKTTGDVYARYMARIEELDGIMHIVTQLVKHMPKGEIFVSCQVKDGVALGAVESWRGEILTVVEVKNGRIERCMPRDPSFCNWALFGIIGPGNIVPDFPLCNKSLDLSYSGTDL